MVTPTSTSVYKLWDPTSVDIQSLILNSDASQHLTHQLHFKSSQTAAFIVDTESPISFLPLRQLCICPASTTALQTTQKTIRGVSGHTLPVNGEITLPITDSSNPAPKNITFIKSDRGPSVLGLDALRTLQVNVLQLCIILTNRCLNQLHA